MRTRPLILLLFLPLVAGCQPAPTAPTSANSAPVVGSAPMAESDPPVASAATAGTQTDTAGQANDDLRVEVQVATEWVELPATSVLKGSRSAVGIDRALGPDGKPAVPGFAVVGANPKHLVRGFRLASDRVLLGEPILVEHVVELHGLGEWNEPIGGNYRRHGRDDNVTFILVHADGSRVIDPYAAHPSFVGGGLGSTVAVKRGERWSYFHAVQRYAAIQRTGRYQLHCVGFHHSFKAAGWREALDAAVRKASDGKLKLAREGNDLVHARDGSASNRRVSPAQKSVSSPSPLAAALPKAVRDALGDGVNGVVDFATFEIEITAPSQPQRDAMVKRWRAVAESQLRTSPANQAEAARQAVWFARQDDFLPVLQQWLAKPPPPQDFHGLAMRQSPGALDLLLGHGGSHAYHALPYLHRQLVPRAFVRLVDRLDDPDDQSRAAIFSALSDWSGQRFGASWDGFHSGRPTVAEAQAMKPAMRQWWAANRSSWKP